MRALRHLRHPARSLARHPGIERIALLIPSFASRKD
jgi:hypothetical protein